ncbi:MAG: saccharopine dehydrogenase [Melioribacter sp.]|nr:saccharopine dehydrogenase [Melioribacter sp.]
MAITNNKLMVYGANGYSAQLIIEELISRGIKPILSGRNESALKELSHKYNCEYIAVDLYDNVKLDSALDGVHTVLNCAGPFKFTAKEIMEACLRCKCNYLDITGEIPAMYMAFYLNQKAKEKRVVFLPSVGFDIIPTDCLAKRLSEQMPDATHLKLGFSNKGGKISRGTWLTTLEFLGGTGRIRRDGKLVESNIGEYTIDFKIKNFSFCGLSIPWGDVYSSYQSTKIPNVEVYIALPRLMVKLKSLVLFFLKILKIPLIKNIVAIFMKKILTGPVKSKRDSTKTYVWGRVENAKGKMIEEIYQVMEGYNLTAIGAAESVERVLKNTLKPGTYTPSLAFGSDFMDLFVINRII